jgi:hydrogenase-4 transcriptional activator
MSLKALQLAVWQEAGRHIQIDEFVGVIARILAQHLPLGCVLLRHIDVDRSCLETLASAVPDSQPICWASRTGCAAAQLKNLLAWYRRAEIIHGPAKEIVAGRTSCIVPANVDGDVLAAPLLPQGSPMGVVVLVAQPRRQFSAAHQAIFRTLIEPFAVALANDRRLHELTTLREAAEADKRSLLSRLGREKLGDVIIGQEAGLKLVIQRIGLVARSDMPVLLLGETGSGKEVIARAIHAQSDRADGPFMRINCGAIPPELIDSELFGHERGSFTGATATRQGWFERADGGTLFLDEVAELPLAAQVRLLRVLQDGSFERVGGHQPLTVDVRIVAATHRDLPSLIDAGRFREDLWYRIAAFPVYLPPLRERLEDIPALAEHFAQKAVKRFGFPMLSPTPDDVALLASYSWPGNVRELAAVMDRAAILGEGKRLEIAKALGLSQTPPRAADTPPAKPAQQSSATIETLDQVMTKQIVAALRATHGRIEGPSGAALVLGINPHTLRARMRKLSIDWRKYRRSNPSELG